VPARRIADDLLRRLGPRDDAIGQDLSPGRAVLDRDNLFLEDDSLYIFGTTSGNGSALAARMSASLSLLVR
jgi:hypothetical protein